MCMSHSYWIAPTVIYLFVIHSVSPLLTPCDSPVKNEHCILTCVTEGNPVTFSHPVRTDDVGICISINQCNAFNPNNNMSQRRENNSYITEFQIGNLDRQRDGGDWFCDYGNLPSGKTSLTVFTRPVNVSIKMNKSDEYENQLTIECTCSCLYTLSKTSMRIEIIGEQDKIWSNITDSMVESPKSDQSCSADEITGYRTISIHITDVFVNVTCTCIESNMGYNEKSSMVYTLKHTPDIPAPHILVYGKILIGIMTYVLFLLIFSAITYKVVCKQRMKNTDIDKSKRKYEEKEVTAGEMLLKRHEETASRATGERKVPGEEHEQIVSKATAGNKLLGEGQEEIGFELLAVKCPGQRRSVWIGIGIFAFLMLIVSVLTAAIYENDDLATQVIIIIVVSVVASILPPLLFCIIDNRLKNGKKRRKETYENELCTKLQDKEISQETKDNIDKDMSQETKDNIEASRISIRLKCKQPFVKTKTFLDGWHRISKLGILIYKGLSGCGKTVNSMQIMDKLMQHDAEYSPIILQDVFTWDRIFNPNVKCVILIENVINSFKLVGQTSHKIMEIFQNISDCLKSGKVKIIMTCETTILDQQYTIWAQLEKYKIFDKKHIIDLSSDEYRLETKDKRAILQLQFPGPETNNQGQELSEEKNLFLSEELRDEIIKTEPFWGFIPCINLFPKHRDIGVRYFIQPPDFFVEEIHKMKDSADEFEKKKYAVLVSVVNARNAVTKRSEYKEARAALLGGCIKLEVDENYVMKHPGIEDAVYLSIGKSDPKSILRNCTWEFIRQYVKSGEIADKNDWITVTIDESDYPVLIDRFLEAFMSSVNEHFRYMSYVGKDFLHSLFDEMHAKNNKDRYKGHKEIVRKSCGQENGIFVEACLNGDLDLIFELSKRYQKNISHDILHYAENLTKHNTKVHILLEKIIRERKKL